MLQNTCPTCGGTLMHIGEGNIICCMCKDVLLKNLIFHGESHETKNCLSKYSSTECTLSSCMCAQDDSI